MTESEISFDLWWSETVKNDIERTAPKVAEYGTRDLSAMGMALMQQRDMFPNPGALDAITAIYGCMFYALGKIHRAIAALERGELPSEDTLFDLSVYSMMARSYKERGKL